MPLVVYSLLRLALLVVTLLALWRAGMGGWLAVVVGAVVAWALSYLLLARPRDRAALWLAERAERRRGGPRFSRGVEADAAAEDEEAEAADPAGAGAAEAPAQIERPSPSSTP